MNDNVGIASNVLAPMSHMWIGVMDMYQIIDSQTGLVVGTYSTAKRARAARDRKDLEYGAIRYAVRIAGAEPL